MTRNLQLERWRAEQGRIRAERRIAEIDAILGKLRPGTGNDGFSCTGDFTVRTVTVRAGAVSSLATGSAGE